MPRNQGTSRKGKPKKEMRSAGFGKALQRCVTFLPEVHDFLFVGGQSNPALHCTACHTRPTRGWMQVRRGERERERMRKWYIYFSKHIREILKIHISVVLTFSISISHCIIRTVARQHSFWCCVIDQRRSCFCFWQWRKNFAYISWITNVRIRHMEV